MTISPQNSVWFFTLLAVIFDFVVATPEWYTASDGNEYLIEKESKYNWLQAYDECARRDSHLVVIDNAEKNKAFDALLRQIFDSAQNLWLGYHDEFNKEETLERPFYSIATGKPLSFSNWLRGEPNNSYNNEHCVHIYSLTDFQWNDTPCDEDNNGYVCEKNQHSTNCDDMNMEEIRLSINDMNQQLSADYVNVGIQIKEIFENNYNISQNIFEGLNETTNEILTKSKANLDAMVLRKPYLNAVIADVGDEIREIIRTALEDISKVSSEAQQTIANDFLRPWASISDLYLDFADKLQKKGESIDNLFV